MKILNIWSLGSNEIHNLVPKVYPDSSSVNVLHLFEKGGETAVFDKLHKELDKKPEIIVVFQLLSPGQKLNKSFPRFHKFILEASKTSEIVFCFHDTPEGIEGLGIDYYKKFNRVFVPNYEKMLRFKKLGVSAEFFPTACSRPHNINLAPFRANTELKDIVCFFVEWLYLKEETKRIGIEYDRRVYLRKLLENKIPVECYGSQSVKKAIEEMDVNKSTLVFKGHKNFYRLFELSSSRVIFNGILHGGELSINRRFYISIGIGTTQLYPHCGLFEKFCDAFFGEIPSENETPVVLFRNPDDFVEKAKQLLSEPIEQAFSRRKKACEYREKWTFEDMVKVLGHDKENPSLKMQD